MPSAGITRRILQRASSFPQNWPAVTALIVFAAEGDNRADAFALAHTFLRLYAKTSALSEPLPRFKEPADWQLLFGGPFEQGLF